MLKSQNQKCTSQDHGNIEAVCYCQECKIYICNKCQILHSKLCLHHHSYKIENNASEIFTGFCKEKNHYDLLDFYCKDHNQLCCASCLCKIKEKGKGQHKDCNVCVIEDIIDEKKNKLNENINMLEDISNIFNKSIGELKIIFEKIHESKDNLKLKIQKIFTEIRNTINNREDELLLEIDNKLDDLFFDKEIIKNSEKLPNKIKLSLEKGKKLVKEWNNGNNIILLINNCINIENNIKEINLINESIKKCNNSNNVKIVFLPEGNKEINRLLDTIKNFGEISFNNQLFYDSLIISNNKIYLDNIINWISPKKMKNTVLLFRKTKDGDSYETFHKLCDNKGDTVVLIKSTEGFTIGGYTPLDWDVASGSKKDKETFLFSLTQNKKFTKNNSNGYSIHCDKTCGPFFHYIGFRDVGKKNMSQGEFLYTSSPYYNDYNEIIPNEKKNRYFEVEEIEVYKIIFN